MTAVLFQTGVEAPSKSLQIEYSGCRFNLTIEGRRITGEIVLDRPNPKHRQVCVVNIQRRAFWSHDEVAAALRVVGHWFRDIGGIAIVQAKHLGHVISRVKAGGAEQPIHWAINVYANKPWNKQERVWMGFNRFIMGDALDNCIEESPEYRAECDRRALERRMRRPPIEILPPPTEKPSPSLRDFGDKELRDLRRQAEKHQAACLAVRRRPYEELTPRDQARIRNKVCKLGRWGCDDGNWEKMLDDREATTGFDGRHVTLFWEDVYLHAGMLAVKRTGVAWHDLFAYLDPPHPHRLDAIDQEIDRRKEGKP